ncbi:MAG: hypothetical protein LUF92_04275 [Clostridiales bacterium]|nr:hypothetical protein [Clostridiales bacterium]
MNGQMKRYKESLKNTSEPVLLSRVQKRVDLREIISYARKKGVPVAELSEQEKSKFIV